MNRENVIGRLEVAIITRYNRIQKLKKLVIDSFTPRQYDLYIQRYQCLENARTLENMKGITLDKNVHIHWVEHNETKLELEHLEFTMTVLCPAWNKLGGKS